MTRVVTIEMKQIQVGLFKFVHQSGAVRLLQRQVPARFPSHHAIEILLRIDPQR